MPYGMPVSSPIDLKLNCICSSGITITASYAIKQSSRLLKVKLVSEEE